MVSVPFSPFEPDKSRYNSAATPEIVNAIPTADGWGPLQGTTIVYGIYYLLANELLEPLLREDGNYITVAGSFNAISADSMLEEDATGMFACRLLDGTEALFVGTDTAIPKFIEVDQITLMDGTEPFELDTVTPKDWEMLTASGENTGRPESWTYFDQKIGFYPIPDAVYTVRVIGQFMKAGPATDGEANNVWMTEAFDLLRARVCRQLALKKLRDADLMQTQAAAETDELRRLISETASRLGTGYVTPTDF